MLREIKRHVYLINIQVEQYLQQDVSRNPPTIALRVYMPQIPQADATLLLGRDVSSYNILANMSEYLASPKSISAKAFSYTSKRGLFCGSSTRLSKIVAAFLQTSGVGCGILITFNSRSIALKLYAVSKSFR